MRKRLRFLQIATIVSMVAFAVVHFSFLNKTELSSLSDIQQMVNQQAVLNGKKTPITKTKQKIRYPADETGFQFHMWIYRSRLCSIELDGITVPVFITGIFSKKDKLVTLVRSSNDNIGEKLKIEVEVLKKEFPDKTYADYILVQQRSIVELILIGVIVILALELIGIGFKRTKEISEI